jgi:hypothetical protein
LLLAGLALLAPAGAARAADIETRDFNVLVDGKRAGEVHMTIHRQDDGAVTMKCDTDVKVRVVFVTYIYSYRGREIWKDGRLQRFDSTCNDDGKRYVVSAVPEGDKLRVRVNNLERMVPGEVWLTSYWHLPDAKLRDGVIPLLDADTGRDLECRLRLIGAEQVTVAGQLRNANHYRLTGKVRVDAWYDASERLVRQDWMEEGHRTILELIRVRR